MAAQPPIKVAILWHMHQPDYREPNSSRMAMPWVRLHGLKDYLDMPLIATRYESIRTTFNLVPSLLDQIELYVNGGTDRHLELSRLKPEEASIRERVEIIQSLFVGNPRTMIEPFPRYRSLFDKYRECRGEGDRLAAFFSSSELRDLQVWSSLAWVDPLHQGREPVRSLMAKERHFSEEEKLSLLNWQIEILREIVPTYGRLFSEGRIDLSFTPYYHPILPLLCDTDVAREAVPSIQLPNKRFRHPEDARRQIRLAADKFSNLFGRTLQGMWPSEGSISEEVIEIMAQEGIVWTAGDGEVLLKSLVKSGVSEPDRLMHAVYESSSGVKILFRDHGLSDRIGFVYSEWPAEKAVGDFVGHLKQLREKLHNRLDEVVVPIILDGENAWEHFPNDGLDFLDTLYRTLDAEDLVQTVTFSEAVSGEVARPLPRIFAGSWINHNFRIWIGHEEDNAAWDQLTLARETLVQYQDNHPDAPLDLLDRAWNQIYIAEGSDWCWWYGDDHTSEYSAVFDSVFRQHLAAVYVMLGMTVPDDLNRPIHGEGPSSFMVKPENILTAQIDGRVSHFYEWTGAGHFDCVKAGGATHRSEHRITGIHFAYDHNRFYIRLDFHDKKSVKSIENLKVVFEFFTPSPRLLELTVDGEECRGGNEGEYEFVCQDILELAVERKYLWQTGYGLLSWDVSLFDADLRLETWPEHEPLQLEVPEKNREMFWPS